MFTQLFGNFLLRKGVVTPDQLIDAIQKTGETHVKLGTLCIHSGIMTSQEVEKVYIAQTHEDKRFGEIAVDMGYITPGQLEELMENQGPNYLLLAQELIEQGYLTHEELERLLYDYQSETELFDLDLLDEHKDKLKKLVENFCNFGDIRNADVAISYLQLLFNDLIRFIGDDFTPMNLVSFQEYATNIGSAQKIGGEYEIGSALDMDENTARLFASRYAREEFPEFDEYVAASLEDFLNLHNGLFVVNVSNTDALELQLEPPVSLNNEIYKPTGYTYLLPIAYTFGTINFLITIPE